MASTHFNTGTVVQAVWCNDVDNVVWDVFLGVELGVQAAGSLFISDGTNYVQQDGTTLTDSLGLTIGSDVQAWDTKLDDIAAVTPTDGNILVGNGTTWVGETPATWLADNNLYTSSAAVFDTVTATNGVTATGADSDLGSTGETVIANGTTAQEATGEAGSIRVDTDTGFFRFHDGTAWQTLRAAGRETIYLPAHSWVSNTTNGASLEDNESTTNAVMYKTYDFDTATDESVQFAVMLPKNWDEGTFIFRPHWTAASGSGTVTWAFAAVAVSNDDAIDAAFGTAVTVTDTLITAGDLHDAGETSAMTIAGTPAEYDMVFIKCYRDVSADTLGVDAKLIGCHIYIQTNAPNDD